MESPVRAISRATASGTRVPRNVPPPAANRPRLTSGSPNFAVEDATMRSQPRSSSKPPATAVAFAAPITGTPDLALDQPEEAPRRLVGAEVAVPAGEGAQVHAGAEGAVASAGEDSRSDPGVGLGFVHRGADAPHHAGVDGVACLGPVQAGHEDVTPPLAHQLVAHLLASGSPMSDRRFAASNALCLWFARTSCSLTGRSPWSRRAPRLPS